MSSGANEGGNLIQANCPENESLSRRDGTNHQSGLKVRIFSNISSILVDNKSSWQDNIFLTFDIDWAHDVALHDTIDLVEEAGVAATWYATHETPVLERLRSSQNFELGIHPNFNFLLEGDARNGRNAAEVVERVLTIVPEAKSVRSHSMTQSSGLLAVFERSGLTHDVNQFVPAHSGIRLSPWLLWSGLCRVPYYWEDDVACMYALQNNMNELASRQGLKVFDFHPIHVFLNTENLDRYESTRHLHHNPAELIKHRYEGVGTRTRLIELLQFTGSSNPNKG